MDNEINKEVIMSKIPDTEKTKYNHNDPFRWVDSQWERFMTEQRELKAQIKQLQKDLGTCTKNYSKLYDIKNMPGAPTDGLEVGSPEDYGDAPLIYESPDGGKTIYQRRANDYDGERELVGGGEQMELFKK